MAAYRVRGLAKLIGLMLKVCRVIDVFGPSIRNFVPSESLSTYDGALSAIKTACDTLRAIEYLDTSLNTNAPWGN